MVVVLFYTFTLLIPLFCLCYFCFTIEYITEYIQNMIQLKLVELGFLSVPNVSSDVHRVDN